MFTETIERTRRGTGFRRRLLGLLAGPHGVDRYTELVDPMWTSEDRATVVRVSRSKPRSVTLWLRPNHPRAGFRAGQFHTVTVEIDGRRHSRCYSPANAEGVDLIELTVARHESGVVSEFLHRAARPGMTVGLSAPAGDFVLPRPRPRRLLLIAGGSGITPVMSMIRTLSEEWYDGEIAVLHYVRTIDDACYREHLATLPDVRVLHCSTRDRSGDLHGHVDGAHLFAAMPEPDAVYVCGPPALVEAVRAVHPAAVAESFTPATPVIPESPGCGRITFSGSGIDIADDGRPLLDQAEKAGLTPQSGCRMGICHTCTRRKVSGMVRNLTTGAISTADDDAVQICVSVPVGDVDIDL
ncbi:MAG: iron-sulfur cluster-binding domain-containing protein [Mycobacterium sp.]